MTPQASWLAAVPDNWSRTVLGHAVGYRSGATPSKDDVSFWDGSIPWVSPKDMKVFRIADAEDHVSERAVRATALRVLPPGCVLMVTRGMILDHTVPIALATAPLTINQDMKALLPRRGVNPHFLAWLLVGLNAALLARVEEAAHGAKALRTEQWTKLPIALPEEREQACIAAFLDRKTAVIDELIAKKERLVALLAEKRQALITQLVTKGLDPSVPMKDSGIEWIGEVPSTWSVMRVRHLMADVVDCPHSTPAYDDDGPFPAIRTADIDRGRLFLATARRVSEATYRERVERAVPREGDILYSREGERFGLAALVPPNVQLCLAQRIMMFRAKHDVSPTFAMWALNSDAVFQQVRQDTVGATAPRINIPTIKDAWLACPPGREKQERVGEEITRLGGQLDVAESAIALSTDRLREYRQALITAAVTGHLDVTNERAVAGHDERAEQAGVS